MRNSVPRPRDIPVGTSYIPSLFCSSCAPCSEPIDNAPVCCWRHARHCVLFHLHTGDGGLQILGYVQWLWRRRPLRWEFTPHFLTLRNTGCLHCTPVISKPRDRRRCQAEGRLKSINRYPTRKLVQVKPSRWTRCRNQQEPRRASGTDVGPPTPSHPDSRCLYLVNDPTVLKHSRVFAHKRAVCPLVLSTRLQPISRTALELSLFPCPASSLSAPRESECSVLSGIRNKLQLTRLFSVQNTKPRPGKV